MDNFSLSNNSYLLLTWHIPLKIIDKMSNIIKLSFDFIKFNIWKNVLNK